MKTTTDTEKCLQALISSGATGVHSFDMNAIIGTTRAAARINDLKAQGYVITSVYEKRGDSHGCRYFLTSSSQPLKINSKKQVKEKTVYTFNEETQTYQVYV